MNEVGEWDGEAWWVEAGFRGAILRSKHIDFVSSWMMRLGLGSNLGCWARVGAMRKQFLKPTAKSKLRERKAEAEASGMDTSYMFFDA